MNKKKGVIILIILVSLLSVVNAAWILNYSAEITTKVIGKEKTYSFSHKFKDIPSLDTTQGPNSTVTNWEIEDLDTDLNVTFKISTHKTNLTSEKECPEYKTDCRVIVTHIYEDDSKEVKDILSYTEGSSVTGEANFILLKDISNIIEYRVECARNSCSQEITSEINIEEMTEYFPED